MIYVDVIAGVSGVNYEMGLDEEKKLGELLPEIGALIAIKEKSPAEESGDCQLCNLRTRRVLDPGRTLACGQARTGDRLLLI